jgi:hypothetical protein
MATENQSTVPDIGLLHRLIATTRQLLRATWTATGVGVTAGIGLSLLVLVSLADLATAFGEWLRLFGLLLVLVPSGWAFLNGVLRPLLRRMTSRFVARRIEANLPGIHNRLVSVVDLDSERQQHFSPAFVRRLLTEALERVRGFKPWSVVDQSALKRSGIFALIGILVFSVALGIFSDRLPTALARIFSPFADIPPATGVLFDVQPGTCKVLRGEPIEFVATVTKGNVDRVRLQLQPLEGEHQGKTLWHELRQDNNGQWAFRLPAFDSSFEYRVHGGGTWTKLARVTMLDRPRLVGLQAAVRYPSYMLMPEPRVNPPDVADVTGPIDSTVEVTVNVEGDALVGEIQLLREEVRKVPVSDRPLRAWFEDSLPAGHAVEGRWDWGQANESASSVSPLLKTTDPAKWHSHPAAAGESFHGFHSAAIPFEVNFGDVLFADVFLEADQPVEELMLQFHDGHTWERRAYWGADKLGHGQPGTASRFPAGPLPKSGEWVRLEVAARDLDLEGHFIRGVKFTQFNGKCRWGRVGTIPAATRDVREFVIDKTFPLKALDTPIESAKPQSASSKHFAAVRKARAWTGQFPIKSDGWYRVELKNEIGVANLPMREARITTIPDHSPQIMIERPGIDLVLSEPVKVPIVIAMFDDFGLDELLLSVQREGGSFLGRSIKKFDGVVRADTALLMFDLVEEGVKPGEVLKYRAEVRDRKGQLAQTQDYQIRIVTNDPNAADKQLAQLEKKEEEFAKKLDKLIEDQAKVQKKLEQIAEKSAPLTEKIEAAQDAANKAAAEAAEKAKKAAQEQAAKNDPNTAKPSDTKDKPANDPAKPQESAPPKPEPTLDAATQQELAQLKQELAQLQQEEAKQADVAKQLNEELKQLAKEGANQQLLPPELQREMAAISDAFQDAAAEPIKKLADEIKKSADAKTTDPKLDKLEARADQVQQNLEALKNRMEALREAQKNAKEDAEKALEELRREMLKQSGGLTAQELAELRAAIEAMREKLQKLAGEESDLLKVTPEAPELLLPDIANRQADLERRADKELGKVKELQRREDYQALKQKTNANKPQPNAANPLAGDEPPEMAATPEDFGNTSPMPEDNGNEFQPAIADPQKPLSAQKANTKPDAAKNKSPQKAAEKSKPAQGNEKPTAAMQRESLSQREARKLDQLQRADESLAADERALNELLKEFRELMKSEMSESAEGDNPMPGEVTPAQPQTPPSGEPMPAESDAKGSEPSSPLSPEQAAELAKLLQSSKTQKALQMAARLQAMQSGEESPTDQPGQQPPNGQPPPPHSAPKPVGLLEGDPSNQFAMEAVLRDLDPTTRSLILKMQPRVREELLQSLREEGPEGYQRFIRDYFKRLTKAGDTKR